MDKFEIQCSFTSFLFDKVTEGTAVALCLVVDMVQQLEQPSVMKSVVQDPEILTKRLPKSWVVRMMVRRLE